MHQGYDLFMKLFPFTFSASSSYDFISFHSIRTRVDGWSNKLCIFYKRVHFSFSLVFYLFCCWKLVVDFCLYNVVVFHVPFSVLHLRFDWIVHSFIRLLLRWCYEIHVRLRCPIAKSDTKFDHCESDVTLETSFLFSMWGLMETHKYIVHLIQREWWMCVHFSAYEILRFQLEWEHRYRIVCWLLCYLE